MSKSSKLMSELTPYGDIHHIARITGYKANYIRKVLNDQRQNTLVHDVAYDIVTMRRRLVAKYEALGEIRGVTEKLERVRGVESMLLKLALRPVRGRMHYALKKLEVWQDTDDAAEADGIVRNVIHYDTHIMDLLEWLQTQRIYLDPVLRLTDLNTTLPPEAWGPALPEHTVEVYKSRKPLSVQADPYLTGVLVKALMQQAGRITSPTGSIVLRLKLEGTAAILEISCTPCLLLPANLAILNHPENLRIRHTGSDMMELVAVAGHFIMSLHRGRITWGVDEAQTATIRLEWPAPTND